MGECFCDMVSRDVWREYTGGEGGNVRGTFVITSREPGRPVFDMKEWEQNVGFRS